MRRRNVGYANAKNRERIERDFQQIGDSIAAKELEQLQKQMETFKSSLQDFAQKHQKDIRKDPTFRSHFQRMCANIGVDPLASNKGFWADLLGVGDFYYELGVQVIEACITSRDNDGGLTELEEVLRRVKLMRGITSRSNAKRGTSSSNLLLHRSGSGFLLKKENDLPQIIEDDIIRAIKILKPLSGGYEVLQIGNRKLVRSVPKELDKDQSSLLLLAQKTGYVDRDMIRKELGWSDVRIKTATQHLLQDGIAWLDKFGDQEFYWIPGYFISDKTLR